VVSRAFAVATLATVFVLAFTGNAHAGVPDERDKISEPQTSTIAGSGARGRADGPALAATFLTPSGVAVGAGGAIYIADVAAQDIRVLRAGTLQTVAGASDPGNSPENRVGGFADGPARTAKFDRPIAIATHGTDVYVADAGNHCVRKIANGNVTTIARNFTNLKGIAVADGGEVYVADDGAGIRRIDPRGRITTLPLPTDHQLVLGVALRTIAGREYLAYTDATHVYLGPLGSAKPQSLAYDDEREPDGTGAVVGHTYGVAILNENTLAVTDTTTHTVRLIRFPAPPFVAGRVVRVLAGGNNDGTDITGGFGDGPPWRSRFDTPTAIAIADDGSLVVADAGNRRIRKIANVDARESVLPDLSNFTIPDRSYHVAIVGNSYAFYNVLWPESIGGRIEAELSRDATSIALPAPPAVSTFRIDAASDDAAISIIHEYLYDHRTSLIVFLLNSYVAMRSDTLLRLRSQLDSVGIKLLVVFTPQGFEVSPRDFWSAKRDEDSGDALKLRAQAARAESYYNMTHVHGLFLLDAMEAQGGTRNRQPLFYSSEHHFTVYGSEWVGRRIVDELERWRPWRKEDAVK
jgi:hypothetical protein